MKKVKLRLATTHLDRHNEKMSKGSLENMVEQTNRKIIPMGIEHDPRIPPQGRVIKAELVKLDDGEFAVEGIAEIFDGDFSNPEDIGERTIPVRTYKMGKLKIVADRNFRTAKSQDDLNELMNILKSEKPEEEIKKALDPISILTIGGGFLLGNIVNGFIGQIGGDAYLEMKKKLGEIFSEKPQVGQEKLFTFDTTISNGTESVNVEVIISNPTVDILQEFFDNGMKQLDEVLPRHFEGNKGFSRIVFEYKDKRLMLTFAVLKNGIPVKPN